MFAQGELSVKIDRPAGVVDFSKTRQTEEVLSDWCVASAICFPGQNLP